MENKFKFILSKEKFLKFGSEVDDRVYHAELINGEYIVSWESKNDESGWESVEYNLEETRGNVKEGWWIVVD